MSGSISWRAAAFAGAAAAGAALAFTPVVPPRRRGGSAAGRGRTSVALDPRDVFREDERAALAAAFAPGAAAAPTGIFLRGRHGVTHFALHAPRADAEDPGRAPRGARVIVLAHGLGTDMHLWDDIVPLLRASGFHVLRYDYFGHGWSAADDPYLIYDKRVVLDQLEDVLDHVVGPDGSVFGFVGHSTGGCVGVLAARYLPARGHAVQRLCFVSPAFWADKPLIARLANKAPSVLHAVLRRGIAPFLVRDAYSENGVIAWMREGGDGKYVYPEAVARQDRRNKRMFAHHPYIVGGIFGLDNYILNEALLPTYRTMLAEVVAAAKAEEAAEGGGGGGGGGGGTRVQVLWGEGDQTVPWARFADDCRQMVETVGMPNLGHESIYEDSATVGAHAVEFFSRA